MSHTPHELREEFPEYEQQLHDLKTNDAHFRKLGDEYHDVNRAVHRAEIGEDHLSPTEEEDLRKRRMALKDEIYVMLQKAAA